MLLLSSKEDVLLVSTILIAFVLALYFYTVYKYRHKAPNTPDVITIILLAVGLVLEASLLDGMYSSEKYRKSAFYKDYAIQIYVGAVISIIYLIGQMYKQLREYKPPKKLKKETD